MHFRQTDARRFQRHTEVAAKRGFQSAAERRAVNGADHRFVHALDGIDNARQSRRLHRLAELANVSPGNKRPARADDDCDVGIGVFGEAVNGLHQAVAHGEAGGVHRRVVDGDHGNAASLVRQAFIGNGIGHGTPPMGTGKDAGLPG